MRRLSAYQQSPEAIRARPPYQATIIERKGAKRKSRSRRRPANTDASTIVGKDAGQLLTLTSNERIVAYAIPEDSGDPEIDFGQGPRPDAVVIAELHPDCHVFFVELKSEASATDHGLDQVIGGINHFAPLVGSHGEFHHKVWADGEDAPAILPPSDHHVHAVVVVFRGLLARRDRLISLADKDIPLSAVHIPMRGFNRAEIDIRELVL